MVHRFLFHTPLDPNQVSIRTFFRSALLETRSRRGLTANSLCVWGREPLRSASRLLGFVVSSCFWEPGHGLVAAPGNGPLRSQDLIRSRAPSSFLEWHIASVYTNRVLVAMRLLCLKVALIGGYCGHECRCGNRHGHFFGCPLHWVSIGIHQRRCEISLFIGGQKRYSRRGPRIGIRREQVYFCSNFFRGGKGCVVNGLPSHEKQS